MTVETHACSICKEVKPIDQFDRWRSRAAKSGWRCKACRRSYMNEYHRNVVRYRQYGLTREQFEELCESQDGWCAICRRGLDGQINVDHDHGCCPGRKSCGKCVRGILCSHCNRAIGLFADDVDILRSAISYLLKAGMS